MLRALGVIPSRYGSTRFRGKPLAPLDDRTLVQTVWSRARDARRLTALVIATDDTRIADHARAFGADVRMTSPEHPSGSDRVAEVVRGWSEPVDVVVNIQGDEPLVTGTAIDRLLESFDRDDAPDIATLSEPIDSVDEVLDPNIVKVVTTDSGRALYFSRSPIPYVRSAEPAGREELRSALVADADRLSAYRKHQGIYAYRATVLEILSTMKPSTLERLERLEQLRALQSDLVIRVIESDFRSIGVDTPEDLDRVRSILAGGASTTQEECPR